MNLLGNGYIKKLYIGLTFNTFQRILYIVMFKEKSCLSEALQACRQWGGKYMTGLIKNDDK